MKPVNLKIAVLLLLLAGTVCNAFAASRDFIYSGTGDGFAWFTTADGRTDGWQGVYSNNDKVWVDWRVLLNDQELKRSAATIESTPLQTRFVWSREGITITLSRAHPRDEYFRFTFTGSRQQPGQLKFRVLFENESWTTLPLQKFSLDSSHTIFSAVYSSPRAGWKVAVAAYSGKWNPVALTMSTPSGLNDYVVNEVELDRIDVNSAEIAVAYGRLPDDALINSLNTLTQPTYPEIAKPAIEFTSESPAALRQSSALQAATQSLRGFIKRDTSELWAGYPWFAEAWGRDAFISLPGACLVNGDYATARKILITFAKWMDRNPRSPTFGRIPNRANPREIVFNTADGTPWWVRSLYEYGLYSGDFDLWEEMLRRPTLTDSGTHVGALRVAMAGSILRSAADTNAFLPNGEQETWMDAYSPPVGAWTPRNKFAVEIQALWATQLQAAISMAEFIGPDTVLKANVMRWKHAYARVAKSFPNRFLNLQNGQLYDRIQPDGTRDAAVRPNQFFAFTAPYYPIIPDSLQESIAQRAFEELVTPYGVLSLSPRDENFHPYHMHSAYPKDAAYHTGIVWTWLSGAVKEVCVKMAHPELAWRLLDTETDLLLENSHVRGTLPELLDAVAREKTVKVKGTSQYLPRQSGTVSQTWSLAEYLRTFYQSFLGVRPVLDLDNRVVWKIDPRLKEEWGELRAHLKFAHTPVQISAQQIGTRTLVSIFAEGLPDSAGVVFSLFGDPGVTGELTQAGKTIQFEYDNLTGEVKIDGKVAAKTKPRAKPSAQWAFADVKVRKNLPALKAPDWKRVGSREGTLWNDHATVAIVMNDSLRDETQQGYSYPLDNRFLDGIFDLKRATISYDNERVYFTIGMRTLTQPGWHPEYGFQLTMCAVAIVTGENRQGASKLGMNAQLPLDVAFRPDRLLYIGGGYRLADHSDHTLIECVADDAAYPIGSPSTGEIRVSVPRKLLGGDPAKWRVLVVAGGQDDHGGAGMGEFRAVQPLPTQWQGGGNNGGSNVYDTMSNLK